MLTTQIDTVSSRSPIDGEAKAGRMSLEEAQAAAKEHVKNLRYRGEEYFFILDTEVRGVMHPNKPKLDNTDLSGIKDPEGKALFVEFAETAKNDKEGYVSYLWPNPAAKSPSRN